MKNRAHLALEQKHATTWTVVGIVDSNSHTVVLLLRVNENDMFLHEVKADHMLFEVGKLIDEEQSCYRRGVNTT